MNNEEIGRFLQELRQEKKLTQMNLAQICNVTHQAVSQWETGKTLPDLESLKSLSELYDISINEILECKRKELNNKENHVTNKEGRMPKEVQSSLVISFIVFITSFLLIIVGLVGNVFPLMILPAFVITIYHCIDTYLMVKNNDEINRTFLLKGRILLLISFVFFIISVIILFAYIDRVDMFGFLQPIIYIGLVMNYYINYKNLEEKEDNQNKIEPVKSMILRNKTQILYYISLVFPTFFAFAMVVDLRYSINIIESYRNWPDETVIAVLSWVYMLLLLLMIVLIIFKKKYKVLIVINTIIISFTMLAFLLSEWIIDMDYRIEAIIMPIIFIISLVFNIYASLKMVKKKELS